MTSKRRYIFPAIAIAVASLLIATISTATVNADNGNDKSQGQSASDFWTADKIKKAEVFDMVFDVGSTVGKRVTVTTSVSGTDSPSVLGTSWTAGGLPLAATGKVFFAIGKRYFQCSGALIQETSTVKSIVLTAGHCVWDSKTSKYATNFIFIPSYDINVVTVKGCTGNVLCWSTSKLSAHSEFTSQKQFTYQATWYDWGFATIDKRTDGSLPDLGGTNNFFPFAFSHLTSGTINAFGYPAGDPYTGDNLVYSFGSIGFDGNNDNKTYSLPSNMTGGSSGGPWLSSMATTGSHSGILSSVNSYKYSNTPNSMFGPKFNGHTNDTYSQALGK